EDSSSRLSGALPEAPGPKAGALGTIGNRADVAADAGAIPGEGSPRVRSAHPASAAEVLPAMEGHAHTAHLEDPLARLHGTPSSSPSDAPGYRVPGAASFSADADDAPAAPASSLAA